MLDPSDMPAQVLRSDFDLEFTYTRTYGPVLSRFFTALKAGKILGIKGSKGQVICPPLEYDPETSDDLSEFVELCDTGVVSTWSWVNEPLDKHDMDAPFAWALVIIDGADTGFLHKVAGERQKPNVQWHESKDLLG